MTFGVFRSSYRAHGYDEVSPPYPMARREIRSYACGTHYIEKEIWVLDLMDLESLMALRKFSRTVIMIFQSSYEGLDGEIEIYDWGV